MLILFFPNIIASLTQLMLLRIFYNRYTLSHPYPWIIAFFIAIQSLNYILFRWKKGAIFLLIANVPIIGFWMYFSIYFWIYYVKVKNTSDDNITGYNIAFAVMMMLVVVSEIGIELLLVKFYFLLHRSQSLVYRALE